MSEVKIIQTTPLELSSMISESVKTELEKFKKELSKSNSDEILLTREETCELLSINLSTLWSYTKKGKLPSKKIGNRVYYLKSEVLEALNS
ncbi:helix-turn-helix domain-containing protein [Winogradskyella sp. ECml5-4]|uniref:helix-turn-helix transcriptional regulator n=1 Tax=Winogradskyella sp. ECml5-4 TaxID=3110975 RepID=UPI002FF33A09